MSTPLPPIACRSGAVPRGEISGAPTAWAPGAAADVVATAFRDGAITAGGYVLIRFGSQP
jgi:hypothetical protein